MFEVINISICDYEEKELKRLFTTLEQEYKNPEFCVSKLCQEVGMSRPTLFRRLQKTFSLSPVELVRKYRLEKAKNIILSKNISITEAAFMVGFNDSNYFSKCFKDEYGVSPRKYFEKIS